MRGKGASGPGGTSPPGSLGGRGPGKANGNGQAGLREDAVLERTRRNFVLGLIAALALLSFLVFRPFISYVFMGLLFVYLVYPAQRALRERIRMPRVSALVVLLVSVLVLVAPFVWVGFEITSTIMETTQTLGGTSDSVADLVDRVIADVYVTLGLVPPDMDDGGWGVQIVEGLITTILSFLEERVGDVLGFAGNVVVGVTVMLFVLYYGLVDGESLLQFAKDASPLDDQLNRELIEEVRKTVDAVFLGHVIVSIIQGATGGIGFLLFGVPNPLFWGFIMIILSLIPVVGAFLVWMPAAVWLFTQGQTMPALGLFLWGVLVVSTVDNVLRPKIVGARADVHPVLVLVGVLGGLAAFGVIGLVLGPLVLAMFVAVVNFWRRDYLPKYEARHAPVEAPRDSDAGALAETLDQ